MTEALQRKSGAPSPPQLDNLKARITGVAHKTPDLLRITLENGQVWDQSEPESRLTLVALAPGDTVTLRRGLLGAFYLSSDKVRGLRVQRLR